MGIWSRMAEGYRTFQELAAEVRQEEENRELRQRYSLADELARGLELMKSREFSQAFAVFKRAADTGSTDAMVCIGMLYQNDWLDFDGKTGDAHYQRAALWFGKAIDAGQTTEGAEYMLSLGRDYDNGNGVVKDEAKAQRCYIAAAQAGNMAAMFNAAHNAMVGCGTPQDRPSARALFKLLAGQSDNETIAARARQNLALLDQWEREQGRQQGRGSGDTGSGTGKMSRAQALEILDLKENATRPEMKKAWIRLMQQNHPDAGGSNYFAKQLNEVREVLGF